MLYQLRQSLHLGGKDYPVGNHDLPEKAENDPHFLRFVGLGLILDVDVKTAVSLETPQQRSQKLYDRLVGERDKKNSAKAPKEEVKAEVKEVPPKVEPEPAKEAPSTVEELKAKAEAAEKKEHKAKKAK